MADPLLGRTIAQYEIVARLGGGGMGVVYKAHDRKLDRHVALKFLPQQWSHDEGAKQRFVREAQAASATHHPNICSVHDIATADDGQLFIVMGFYDGPTLKQRLESGPLPVEDALDIATQIADGLAKAHAQKVVHRDIKPGNVILTEDGVRIVDFGLATFVDALQLTAQGSTLGTAAYMSPEQLRGEEADARSDVWALGIVLYEMLAGRVPFRGAYAEAISYAIRYDTPPPIRATRPEVPEDVEQLVFRALHKEAAVRYASGRELARALRQVRGFTVPQELRTTPIDVPAGAAMRTESGRRPRRAWYAAAALAAVLFVATPLWIFSPVERVPVAVAPVINQTGYRELQPYRMALTQELVSQLTDSRSVRVLPYERLLQIVRKFRDDSEEVSSREAQEAIAAHGGARLVVVPILLRENDAWKARAEIRDSANPAAVTTIETDPITSALPKSAAYDLSIQLARHLHRHFMAAGPLRASVHEWIRGLPGGAVGAPSTPRLETLDAAEAFERGLDAYEQMEYAAARAAFSEAASRSPRSALPLAWQSRVAALMRQDKDAGDSADRAWSLGSAGLPPADRLFVEAVIADARDPGAAEERYRELVERYPDEPTWLIELATYEDRQGRVSNAESAYDRALERDPMLARPHLELCRLYSPSRLNDPAAARREGEAALSAYRAIGNRGGEAQARWCLTDVLRAGNADDRRAARVHADTALELMRALQYPYGLSRAYNYVGVVALLGERNGLEAAQFFEKALEGVRAVGNRFLEPRLLMNLGVSHELLGDRVRAVAYYRDSFALFEALGNQQEAAWSRVNAAAILIDYGGDVEQGARDALNARSVLEKLGDKYFEVFARRMVASYYRHIGRTDDAVRELNVALGIARERALTDRSVQVLIELARLRFDVGEYMDAARLLAEALRDSTGSDRVHARIELARASTRLGRFAAAAASLDEVAREIDAIMDDGSRPLLHAALGELAYERGRQVDAQAAFARSAAFWTDAMPEAHSVEARAYAGLLDASQGQVARGRSAVVASLAQARRMRRLSLEARCLVLLARIDIAAGRYGDAIRTLAELSVEVQQAAGPEMRVQSEYWRSRALAGVGDRAAAAVAAGAARRALADLRKLVPEADRSAWMTRPDIRLASAEVER